MHSSGNTTSPALSEINYGEIAVRHNEANPEILFKVNSGTTDEPADYYVHIKDANWVTTQISGAQTTIDGQISALTENLKELSGATESFSSKTDQKFTAVSGYFINHIKAVSGYIYDYVNKASGDIETTITTLDGKVDGFSAGVMTLSGYAQSDIKAKYDAAIQHTDTASGYIETTIQTLDGKVDAISGYVKTTYATSADTHSAIEAVRSDLGKVYKYKGSVKTYAELEAISATTELNDGDVYNVQTASGTPGTAGYIPAGANFAWVTDSVPGEHGHWDMLGGTIDLSTYATTAYVGTVSGNIKNTIETVSGYIEDTIETVSGRIKSTIETVSGNIENTIKTVSGYIEDTIEANNTAFTAFSAYVVNTYATSADVNTISGWIVSHLQETDQNVTELSAGVESVSGYIVDYVDNTVSAGVHNTITGLSASTINIETKLGQLSGETMAIQSGYVRTINIAENADYGVTAIKDENVTGATYTFDFSRLHIDCGSF